MTRREILAGLAACVAAPAGAVAGAVSKPPMRPVPIIVGKGPLKNRKLRN